MLCGTGQIADSRIFVKGNFLLGDLELGLRLEAQGPNNQDQQEPQQSPEEQPKISPQAAQQMLQAIQAKEKETQDKVKKEKAAALKARQKDKNW